MDAKTAALEPMAVSAIRAASLLGIGRTAIFGLMRDGSMPYFKRGRRTLIAVEDLRRWVDERAAEARRERAVERQLAREAETRMHRWAEHRTHQGRMP